MPAGDEIDVFVSYSRAADSDFAPALHRGLSRLAKPWNQPTALRVFRDRTDLSAAESLTAEIENALARARYFILLASPQAARSQWVNREIEFWMRNKQPSTFMIALTDGEIHWHGDDFDWRRTTALPEFMSGWFSTEPIWEDFRELRSQDQRSLRHSEFRSAIASLAAKPRGLSKRQLDSEDVRLHKRAGTLRRGAVTGLAILLIVSLVMGAGFLIQRDEARRQRDEADARAREVVAAQLIDQSERMLTGAEPGGDIRAIRQILAAHTLSPGPRTDGAIVEALNRERELVRVLDLPGYTVTARFSPDNKRILAADSNGVVRVLDASTWQVLRVGQAASTPAPSAFSPDGTRVLSCVNGDSVRMREVETDKVLGEYPGIRCQFIAFSADGGTAVVDVNRSAVQVLDGRTGQPRGDRLTAGDDPSVQAVAVNGDGTLAVTASWATLRIWDLTTGRVVIGPWSGSSSTQVSAVTFSPDGTRVASSGNDRAVRFWDTATGSPVGSVVDGGIDSIDSVAYSPDGRRLIGAGTGALRMWDPSTGQTIASPWPSSSSFQSILTFSPDGTRVLSRDNNGQLRVWTDQGIEQFGLSRLHGLAVRPDGHWSAAMVDGSYAPKLISYFGGNTVVAHPVDADYAVFTRDGTRALTDQLVTDPKDPGTREARGWRIWDTSTGEPTVTSDHTEKNILTMALSPDGTRVLTNTVDGRLRWWDAATGHPLGEVWSESTTVLADVAISDDNTRAVTVDLDGSLRLWDTRTGTRRGGPWTTDAGIAQAKFLPDGRHIVFARQTGLQLWDIETGKPLSAPRLGHVANLVGGATSIHAITIAADGLHILTAADNGTLRIWDAKTGEPIGGTLQGHVDAAWGVDFGRDGKTIVSAGADGNVLRWPGIDTDAAKLCAKLTDDMSETEWHDWVDPAFAFRRPCPNLPAANR